MCTCTVVVTIDLAAATEINIMHCDKHHALLRRQSTISYTTAVAGLIGKTLLQEQSFFPILQL